MNRRHRNLLPTTLAVALTLTMAATAAEPVATRRRADFRDTPLGLALAPETDTRAEELRRLVVESRWQALDAELAPLLAGTSDDAARDERLMAEVARELADAPPSPGARAVLKRLAAVRERGLRWVEGCRMPRAEAHFPVSAPAAMTLAHWDDLDARARIASAIAQGRLGELLSKGAPALRAGTLESAFTAAGAGQWPALRTMLDGPEVDSARLGVAWAALARVSGEAVDFERAFRHADAALAIDLVPDVVDELEPKQALALLEQIARVPAVSGAAVGAIGGLAMGHEPGRRWLLEHLADPQMGADAAFAVSRLIVAGVVPADAVRSGLDTTDGTVRLHAVMTLRLAGNDASRALLREWAATQPDSDSLAREVRQWLAR